MADIFLSYSRRDRVFVEQLRAALEGLHRTVWVDLRDIPPSADWRDEIHQAITDSSVFICVLSPDYAASEVCREEVEFALANQKRLIPIVLRDVSGAGVLPAIAALNWIFFRESDNRATALHTLLAAMDADLPYLRSGARLLARAKEWETKGRNNSFTLRGKDLAEAEQWLATSGGKQPAPSQEQTQYIVASRRASSRRQRTTISALTVGILITLILSIISTALYKVTSDQNVVLRAHATAGSASDAIANGHLDQGLVLAVAASKQYDDFDTRNALLDGLDSAAYLDSVLIGPETSTTSSFANYTDVMYSADGATLMAADIHTHTVLLWDAAAHKLRRRISIPEKNSEDSSGQPLEDTLLAAALSPDGQTVATKSYLSGIQFFSATDGSLQANITGADTQEAVFFGESVVYSKDGNLLAWSECATEACDVERVTLLDTRTDTLKTLPPLSMKAQADMTVSLAFSADGTKLAAGELDNSGFLNQRIGGVVDVFDLTRDTLARTITLAPDSAQGIAGDVRAVAFSPDGSTLAIAGSRNSDATTGQILLWNVAQGRFTPNPLVETEGPITAEAFSPDGRFLVTACEGAIGLRIWSVKALAAATPLIKQHTEVINAIAFGPDGRHFVTGGEDGQLLIWRDTPYTALSRLSGDGFGGLSETAFSPDGSLLATGDVNSVTLWSVRTGQQVKILTIPPADRDKTDDAVGGIAFSPDGKLLAAGDQLAQVIVWDVASGEPAGPPLKGHIFDPALAQLNFVMDVQFSPDGAWLASSGLDGQAALWDTRTWTVTHTFTGLEANLRQTAFSPDGRYLAVVGATRDIEVWDIARAADARTLTTGSVRIRALAFYPNHSAALAAMDENGLITTWDVTTGKTTGQSMANGKLSDTVFSPHLTFNKAGSLLVSSHDLTVTVWAMSGPGVGQPYMRSLTPAYSVLNTALSPDGRYLAIATNGIVETRYLSLAGWRASACATANRNLTTSEWSQFIPSAPYLKVC